LENGLTNLKRNKMEKETLEEVATKVLNTKYPYHRPTDAGYWKDMFISGANYQAERMYSQEEVYNILVEHTIELFKGQPCMLDEFFEQFKKK